jgi:hypothetical protein
VNHGLDTRLTVCLNGGVHPGRSGGAERQDMDTETVRAGRSGTKVHLRYDRHPTTLCGQGLSTRGGRASGLFVVRAEANCQVCLAKVGGAK